MISYTALTLSIIGSIWAIFILARVVTRKKKPKPSIFKRIFKSMMPFLSQNYPSESMEFLFSHALKTLKAFIPSKNYKYQLPWYAAIGSEEVGKTTFLKSLALENPIDADEFSNEHSYCYWHFFNGGVFLDIKGALVKQNTSIPSSNEAEWDKFINILSKVRANKGLDGIVLFISLKDLFGPTAKSKAELAQDAEYIYAKLWQLQKKIELKLPIYVVFTHLDYLAGFNEFAQSLPKNLLQDIFGWSSPYSLENAFDSRWIENMFDSMSDRLQEIQSELFVKHDAELNPSVLEFFAQFRSLKFSIKTYIERLFQANTYTPGYFLRGIYFVGIEFSMAGAQENWPQLPGSSVVHKLAYAKHLFATSIITQKVLLEKNLGRIIGNATASYRMKIRLMQIAIGSFIVAGGAYLTNASIRLSDMMNIVHPRVMRVSQMLSEHKNTKLQIDDSKLMQQAQDLLNDIINLNAINLRLSCLPTSWFSRFHYKMNLLLEQANDIIIVKAISLKIDQKYKELANFHIKEFRNGDKVDSLKNPMEHTTYKQLHEFIEKMVELNKIEQHFIAASENGNLKSYAWLINKLIGIRVPSKFYSPRNVFSLALRENSIQTADLAKYKDQIRDNVNSLFDNFINHAFKLPNFIANFNQLQEVLYALEDNPHQFNIMHLNMLQSDLSNMITFVNSQEFMWMQHEEFNTRRFFGLMQYVEQLPLLGHDYAMKIIKRVNHEFSTLKASMQTLKLPVIGTVFYINENSMLKVTDNTIALQGILNNLFAEKFMQDYEETPLIKPEYGKAILWNTSLLESISEIFESYDVFIQTKLESYPTHLVKMLRIVTKRYVDEFAKSKLAQAQQLVTLDFSSANTIAVAQNVKASYASMAKIMKHMQMLDLPTFEILVDIEKQRSMEIIKAADKMLTSEALYDLTENEIQMDNIMNGRVYFAFDINDYLLTQRNKITFFANEVVDPVVKTLEFIDSLDNETLTPLVAKWIHILRDLDLYKKNGQASGLFMLESFIKQFEVLKPEDLGKLMIQAPALRTKSDNYFEAKLAIMKSNVAKRTQQFVQQTVASSAISSLDYYNKYRKYFPFNLDGDLMPIDAMNELDAMLKRQSTYMDIVNQIAPNMKFANLQFVEGLDRMNKLVQFLSKPGATMNLQIYNSSALSETFEKSLEYLVNASITSGGNTIYFPDKGQLKVNDKIIFRFNLANQSGVSFLPMKDPDYAASNSEMVVTLNKQAFVRMLLKNGVIRGGETILKFEFPIINKQGVKQVMVFAVPVEFSQAGGEIIKLPEKPIDVLAKNVKV